MKSLLPLFLIALFSSSSFAGGISSTGGDDHAASDGSAWFIGDRTVRYCLEIDPAFGVSQAEASKQIANVFTAWRNYIEIKRVNEKESEGSDSDIEDRFHLGHIAMKTSAMDSCDGSEDIKFFFGISNSDIRKYATAYTEPVAFAQRTKYDEAKGWGKGFVWVQMPGVGRIKPGVWRQPFLLYGVLLHEIGHVLGNSHIGNTIMDETVPALAGEGGLGEKDQGFFTHIDNRHELYFCRTCDFDFAGSDSSSYAMDPEVFELLTGRAPVGKVKSRLYSLGMPSMHPKITYELADEKGQFTFELGHDLFLSHLTLAFGDTPVFKKAVNYIGWGRSSDAATYLLSITTKKGKKLRVLMARNMGVAPMSLQLLTVKPGWVAEFFEAQTY